MATRYAVCRRQFAIDKNVKVERKLIDYQTHMHILGPHLANAIVMQVSARKVEQLLYLSNKEVEKGNYKLLDILHHYTSGFKGCFTEFSYKGSDELRQSVGGVGYHVASGLVDGFTDHANMPTFEGVNVIMLQ